MELTQEQKGKLKLLSDLNDKISELLKEHQDIRIKLQTELDVDYRTFEVIWAEFMQKIKNV